MNTPITAESGNRRSCFVSHFLSAGDAYLELVRRDLSLDCNLMTITRYIRPLFVSLGREPTVAELCFCVEAINSGKRLDDVVRIGSVNTSNSALSALLCNLVGRCSETLPDPYAYISLTRLFTFAASGGLQASPTGAFLSLMSNDAPMLPTHPFSQPSFAVTDRYTLCFARSATHSEPRQYEVGALLWAEDGVTAAERATAVAAFCESAARRNISFSYLSLSDRGLMRDLVVSFPGAYINVSALPGSPEYPESAYMCCGGSALITVCRADVPSLGEIAEYSGLHLSAPVSFTPSQDTFTSASAIAGVSVSFNRACLRALDSVRICDLRCGPSPSPDCEKVGMLSCNIPETEVCAYRFTGGNIGGVLSSIINRYDTYAMAGTLCPDAPETLPSSVALDAFVSESTHPAAATCFSLGDRTEFTVFTLKRK